MLRTNKLIRSLSDSKRSGDSLKSASRRYRSHANEHTMRMLDSAADIEQFGARWKSVCSKSSNQELILTDIKYLLAQNQ